MVVLFGRLRRVPFANIVTTYQKQYTVVNSLEDIYFVVHWGKAQSVVDTVCVIYYIVIMMWTPFHDVH